IDRRSIRKIRPSKTEGPEGLTGPEAEANRCDTKGELIGRQVIIHRARKELIKGKWLFVNREHIVSVEYRQIYAENHQAQYRGHEQPFSKRHVLEKRPHDDGYE